MKLSIIIPVYNVEKYLAECLDSVIRQMKPEHEIICVNDGSTDGSAAILREYKDKYPDIILFNRLNGGLSAARNSGLVLATGEYIYFLDSDDYLFPSVLKLMVDFAEKNELDIATFNVKTSTGGNYFDITINQKSVSDGINFFKNFSKFNSSLPVSPVWMYLYRKTFLDKNKIEFKEGIVLEDNHYTLRVIFLADRIQLLNIPIQYHRIQRVGAETHTVTKAQIDSLLFTCRDLFEFYNSLKCTENSFFFRIFAIYLNIAARVLVLKNYNDEIFTKQDYFIMKQCLINKYYIMHYLLLRFKMYRTYDWYIDETKNTFIKKNLRRLARIYWKIFNYNA